MHRFFRFGVLLGASLLFTGCSTADKRIGNLEGQMQNMQVLDLRLSNAEERLTKVEGEVVAMKEAPAPISRTAAAPPQPVTVAQPVPSPAPVQEVPQPYESTYTGGRKVEPRPAASPPPPITAPADPAEKPAPVNPSGDKPVPAIVPVSMAASAPAAAKETSARAVSPAAPKTGTGAYDAALALYYKGQYAKAQEGFSDFLRQSPSSKLAPNAMYWQGECQYSQGRFDSAIMTFKDLAGKYPKHPKAAAALLKAGYAYAQMKDMENARFYWQLLIDDFPKSEPANMARERMAQG